MNLHLRLTQNNQHAHRSHSHTVPIEKHGAVRLTVRNVKLLKDIHGFRCPGAKPIKNVVDKGTKKYPLQAAVGPWWSPENRGDDCEGKDWGWFSYAALSNIWCQEMGTICVPSWISMRQKGGDVAAAWQNLPQRGEETTGSQAMRGCHVRMGVWHHSIRCDGIACCQMLTACLCYVN